MIIKTNEDLDSKNDIAEKIGFLSNRNSNYRILEEIVWGDIFC